MRKGHLYLLVFVAVSMGFAFFSASRYTYLQAKMAPMFVTAIILVLALVQLGKEIRSGELSVRVEEVQKEPEPKVRSHVYLAEGCWFGGFCLGIYLLGFIITIPVFILSYMRTHGGTWKTSILAACFMIIFCYLIFSYLIEVNFYPGLIPLQFELAQ